ncbi:hypothetical protein PUN28_000804 [Cardiocondyla obscurior]|uniref:Uncharacterized protein n=1 Tax=Cardiocondyla obscurior TaxID=286306 RepID=A0AAW2H1B8_9HYME
MNLLKLKALFLTRQTILIKSLLNHRLDRSIIKIHASALRDTSYKKRKKSFEILISNVKE